MDPTRRDYRGFHDRDREFYAHQAHQRHRSRSRSRSPPTRHHTAYRAYESYKPGQSRGSERYNELPRTRDRGSAPSPTGQRAPINAPTGPARSSSYLHKNRSWVAGSNLTTKSSELGGSVSLSRGGEESLPTPASPTASAFGSGGQQSPASARASDNSSAIRGPVNETGNTNMEQEHSHQPSVNTQLANAQVAPAAPMGSAGIRSASASGSNTPITSLVNRQPISFRMALANPSNPVGSSSHDSHSGSPSTNAQIPSTSFQLEWAKLSDDRDAHVIGTLLAKLEHNLLETKVKNGEDDARRFAGIALDSEYATKTAASLQAQRDELSKTTATLNHYVIKRSEISTKMSKMLADAVGPRPQLASTSTDTSVSPDMLTKIEDLETKIEELSRRPAPATGMPTQAESNVVALRFRVDALEKSKSVTQSEPNDTKYAAMQKEIEELKKSTAMVPHWTKEFEQMKKAMETAAATSKDLIKDVNSLNKVVDGLKQELKEARKQITESRESSSRRNDATPSDAKVEMGKLNTSMKKMEEEVRVAKSDASAAKEKSRLVHSNLSSKITAIETRLDDVSTQLETSSGEDRMETDLTPNLRQKLEQHFLKVEDGNSIRTDLTGVQQKYRELEQQVTDVKADVDKVTPLPSLVDQNRTTLTEAQSQGQELQKQLQELKAEFQQLKDARPVPLPSPQPTEGEMQVDPPAPNRPARWGIVQRELQNQPTLDALGQTVSGRLGQLETCITGIIQRLDNTSMQPQAKAMLALMIERMPSGPEILQEIRQAQQQRAEVEKLLAAHRQEMLRIEQGQKLLEGRLEASERSIAESGKNSSELESTVRDLKLGLKTVQNSLEAAESDAMKKQERLDQMDPILTACDAWYKKTGPEMQAKLGELTEILDESNISKLQQLPDDLSSLLRGSEQQRPKEIRSRSSATPGSTTTATQVNKSVVQANGIDKSKFNPFKDAGDRNKSKNARVFSDRESVKDTSDEDDDDDGIQIISIPSATGPSRQQSKTPSQPSRPTSTTGVRKEGMQQRLLKKPRTGR